jgi:SAM-dependent methyltransferase
MQTEQFKLHADIEERHWWFVARRRIMRAIANQVLPPSPATIVLDVGCGTGGNIAALANDYRCLGIDTSAEAIALATTRFPRVKFVCGTAPDDVREQLRDVRLILLMDVLEHVADDVTLLSNLVSAAPKGTYFLITVPANPRLWSAHDVAFGHYRRYVTTGFEKLWTELPLQAVFVSYFNSRLYPLVKTVRTISRWRGKSGGLAGTDFHMPARPINRLLQRIFAGETGRLTNVLHHRSAGYRRGVSLMALLRREQN